MKKYPAVYIYAKTHDDGLELRHSLRSLSNILNWNGQVFIFGDKEKWFNFDNIKHTRVRRRGYSPYEDVEYKILEAINNADIANEFILMNDDIYATQKTTVRPMHGGLLVEGGRGMYNRCKNATIAYLRRNGHSMYRYSIHVPMIISKGKRLEVHKIIRESLTSSAPLLARNIYGNIYKIGGEYYEDKKSRGDKIKMGEFISTQFFNKELTDIFSSKSIFEL